MFPYPIFSKNQLEANRIYKLIVREETLKVKRPNIQKKHIQNMYLCKRRQKIPPNFKKRELLNKGRLEQKKCEVFQNILIIWGEYGPGQEEERRNGRKYDIVQESKLKSLRFKCCLQILMSDSIVLQHFQPAYQTIDPPHLRIRKSRTPKQTLISNYQLLECIGMGGFAKVFRAVHLPTGQTVAAKVVCLRKLTDSKRSDLNREIEIHRRLIHQNIAQIYEVHEENGNMFIFMEYCSGGQLFDYINEYGPMPQFRARKIFKQVYSATCYLHENFIAHRDIKTQNILLDEHGNAKLIDFGLSNYYGQSHRDAFLETFCGSPSYLSPEMVKRGKYEPKMIDVWCLGVTLYAMVRAQLPFYDPNPAQQNKKIQSLSYAPVGEDAIDELLSCIFSPAAKRISLEEIKDSQFLSKDKSYNPNCLSFEAQSYAIDQQIAESLQKQYNVAAKKIIQSVKDKKLDTLYSLYYLTLQKNRQLGRDSCYDVRSSSFLKGKQPKSIRKRDKLTTLSLHKKKDTEKTATSTPKSIKNPLNLVTLERKRISLFDDKTLLTPLGNSQHATRRMGKGQPKLINRPRRNSDDSPSHLDRQRQAQKSRLANLQALQL